MSTSKIVVDLRARTFEIEVPDARVDAVLDRLEAFFRIPVLDGSEDHDRNGEDDSVAQEEGRTVDGSASAVDGNGSGDTKRKRQPGRGGKIRSYELVELGLTPEQRQAIRDFYAAKAPSQQNDKVAVLGVKLKEILKRSEFNHNEIHSAFKIINEPTPKNLTAVFGNMKRDGRAGYSDSKVVINSHTEDYVQFHMAAVKKSEKK